MMKQNEMTANPGFKRLRKLMDDPRYWRDQDPTYVEMIRQGFRDLYDSPVQAGKVANQIGVNGPVHAQDTEVGHLTKGEIVIPLSAQTSELMDVLQKNLGNDLAMYVVGSGFEQRNPTSGLPAFADDTSWHFEERDAKNVYLPENVNDVRRFGSRWEEYPAWQNRYHDNGIGKPERKFVNPDGREAIYDGDSGELITDRKLRGTFNYAVPSKLPDDFTDIEQSTRFFKSNWKHLKDDIIPYWRHGNDRGDPSPLWERMQMKF
ncbi:hypothetical protein RYZ26_19430 [Terasakiella sp. A23]|uniref:hypothetical protein n=1 Tax=Terasakiella sp. FCG-A23 TaxID=3080561 RepID=UPI002953199A|nr:hypothetical protein [Terasakiella sp. A23]MDV7341782.1 hypothetical protein [Terasakiella sp. A23]